MTATPNDVRPQHQSFWLWVMCLTGVDYFSTLGYQPYLAFRYAGVIAPLATVALVLITLFGALPVYRFIAGRSFTGQGSIAVMVNLFSGWTSKILILILLGFAATDFVITKTLSSADAAEHLINNPNWPGQTEDEFSHGVQRMAITMGLLVLLGGMFLRGFREVIGLAVFIVLIYMSLNAYILISGLGHLVSHPELIQAWWEKVIAGPEGGGYPPDAPLVGSGTLSILLLILFLFPKLALGLSGFETGIAVMPLVRGNADDNPDKPIGRILNTRKLLTFAALIMSVYLLASSMVVTTLIPQEDLVGRTFGSDATVPPAQSRALAYLAHGQGPHEISSLFGPTFGTIYDISTVVILWFAGASAMAALLNLVPQYLPRYGMAPKWTRAMIPLVILFTCINLFVTWIFDASVEAQGAAYATGVLVIMTNDSIATLITLWRERVGRWFRRMSWGFAIVAVAFAYTLTAVIIEKPVGLKIGSCFILTIIVTSIISRVVRSRELRFQGFRIPDVESKLFWDAIRDLDLTILVPHRPGRRSLAQKEREIRREHRIPRDLMIVFVEVDLLDASEFEQAPHLEVQKEEGRYLMKITGAASIAHTLAAVALEMSRARGRPPEIHFGWTDESPWSGTIGFLLFGEGNVPWMVRELIRRAESDVKKRPRIIVAGK